MVPELGPERLLAFAAAALTIAEGGTMANDRIQPVNEALLDERLALLEKARAWSARLVSKLESHVRGAPDEALFRINPFTFARERNTSEAEVIDLFLHATAQGLFGMDWLLICPGCSTVVESFRSLKSVHNHYYCSFCQAHHEAALDEYIAVAFTVSPEIRDIAFHHPEQLSARGAPRLKAHIFISHPHWDHINAFPFFAPLYIPGNEIAVLGAAHGDISMRQLISAQMDSIYFPVTMREFGAHVYFRNLEEGAIEVEGVRVRTKLLNHPGKCLGYRVDYNGRSMCYVTDNELFPSGHSGYNPHYRDELRAFVAGADVLISDACYSDAEYPRKQGWGHSSVGELVDFTDIAGVKSLHLFHHDPDQTDEDIDAKLRFAAERLRERKSKTAIVAPREGDVVPL